VSTKGTGNFTVDGLMTSAGIGLITGAVSGGVGAVVGAAVGSGIGSALGSTGGSIVAGAASGVASGGAGYVIGSAITGQQMTMTGAAEAMAFGGVMGGMGGAMAARGAATTTAEPTSTPNDSTPPLVYRSGSDTPLNMTPRAPQDVEGENPGLSAWTTPESAAPNGGKVQVIDTSKLQLCQISCDISPQGHISITPNDGTSVANWAASRGGPSVDLHTQDVINAIAGTVKVQK
jgi:hypothetical protein